MHRQKRAREGGVAVLSRGNTTAMDFRQGRAKPFRLRAVRVFPSVLRVRPLALRG